MDKVYCSDCKWYCWSDVHFGTVCGHKTNYLWVDKPTHRHKKYLKPPEVKNVMNDCFDYKPGLLKQFKEWFECLIS